MRSIKELKQNETHTEESTPPPPEDDDAHNPDDDTSGSNTGGGGYSSRHTNTPPPPTRPNSPRPSTPNPLATPTSNQQAAFTLTKEESNELYKLLINASLQNNLNNYTQTKNKFLDELRALRKSKQKTDTEAATSLGKDLSILVPFFHSLETTAAYYEGADPLKCFNRLKSKVPEADRNSKLWKDVNKIFEIIAGALKEPWLGVPEVTWKASTNKAIRKALKDTETRKRFGSPKALSAESILSRLKTKLTNAHRSDKLTEKQADAAYHIFEQFFGKRTEQAIRNKEPYTGKNPLILFDKIQEKIKGGLRTRSRSVCRRGVSSDASPTRSRSVEPGGRRKKKPVPKKPVPTMQEVFRIISIAVINSRPKAQGVISTLPIFFEIAPTKSDQRIALSIEHCKAISQELKEIKNYDEHLQKLVTLLEKWNEEINPTEEKSSGARKPRGKHKKVWGSVLRDLKNLFVTLSKHCEKDSAKATYIGMHPVAAIRRLQAQSIPEDKQKELEEVKCVLDIVEPMFPRR